MSARSGHARRHGRGAAPGGDANHRARCCRPRGLQEPWIDATAPIGGAMFRMTIAWAGMEQQTLSAQAANLHDHASLSDAAVGYSTLRNSTQVG
ncbi:MAG: hypothetical protein E6J41_01590 [Chloroflexi bacterium]|nr:MAG: hypothetical protein E6J41_01590 [Chloroflexota bacterium]